MDYRLFNSINNFSGKFPIIDYLMIFLSKKVRYLFMLVIVILLIRSTFHRRVAFCAGISSAITLILHTIVKLIYNKPRPFIKRRVGILIPSKIDSSFPSKHTLLVFAVSVSVFLYERLIGSVLLVLSVLTGFSRIWVGHHYPSDIIGSALIGTLTSLVVDRIARLRNYFN